MAAVEDINVGVHTQQSNERKIDDDDIATTTINQTTVYTGV